MTLPAAPSSLSIADINAECGVAVNTTHGLDWVFEITRPSERPAASGFTPVNVTDQVSGGTVAIANSNLNYYRSNSAAGNGGTGWAYYLDNTRTSNCNNTNCPNCSAANCGNIGGDNCTTTPLADCITNDSRAWLQGNCNCACTFNCNAVQYSHACNCDCPWFCACACW